MLIAGSGAEDGLGVRFRLAAGKTHKEVYQPAWGVMSVANGRAVASWAQTAGRREGGRIAVQCSEGTKGVRAMTTGQQDGNTGRLIARNFGRGPAGKSVWVCEVSEPQLIGRPGGQARRIWPGCC